MINMCIVASVFEIKVCKIGDKTQAWLEQVVGMLSPWGCVGSW